jgi:hypothetical protein
MAVIKVIRGKPDSLQGNCTGNQFLQECRCEVSKLKQNVGEFKAVNVNYRDSWSGSVKLDRLLVITLEQT